MWHGAGDEGQQVAWDDQEAETRTVILTFAVESVIAQRVGSDATEKQLQIWLPLDGDANPDSVAQGLTHGGTMVLFLQHPSYRAARALWTVAFEGTLLGTVADDGTITMGVLNKAGVEFAELAKAARGLTVGALRSAALQQRRVELGW